LGSAFHKREGAGFSRLLQAAEETLAAVPKYHGYAFAIWTTHEEWLLLRNPNPQALSPVYQELLKDLRRCMRTLPAGSEGQLLFDNRGKSEDLSAACAIQNFIVRVSPKRSGPALRAIDSVPDKREKGTKKGPGEAKPPKRR